jgi:uncharacterized Rossmann fold enzyme
MYESNYVAVVQTQLRKPNLPSEEDISRADEWDGFGGGDRGVHHAEEEQRRDIVYLGMYVCMYVCKYE